MRAIDRTEIAKLGNGEYVYAEENEIKAYCKRRDTWVDFYYNHVSPAICRANFEFVGEGSDPYVAARNILEKDEKGRFVKYKVYTEKW